MTDNREAILDAYAEWLHSELRILNTERYGRDDGSCPIGTASTNYHFPLEGDWKDVPPPSSRAASVLTLVGVAV